MAELHWNLKYVLFGTAHSYPDHNRTFQDYVRHYSENVVHPEDNFQAIKNKFRRVIQQGLSAWYQLPGSSNINFVRYKPNNLNTSSNLQ